MNYERYPSNFERYFQNTLGFLKHYPILCAFFIGILVANLWQLTQQTQKIENTAVSAPVTTTAATEEATLLTTVETEPPVLYQTVNASYFDDALFIGDSRTEGLALYGTLSNADYFTSVGLSIYEVTKKSAGNPNVSESVTLSEKLAQKQYNAVYIMLGLNELGTGTTESWAQTYSDVVSQIRTAQPEATIYLESILAVSASQDDPSGTINNATITTRNAALEQLAERLDRVYYLDVNEAVVDANGCLDETLTSDGIHLLGNSLSIWEEYLMQHVIDDTTTTTMVTSTTSATTED